MIHKYEKWCAFSLYIFVLSIMVSYVVFLLSFSNTEKTHVSRAI